MGCSHSSGVESISRNQVPGQSLKEASDQPLTVAEIDSRIDAIPETKTAVFGGVRVRYAFLSQRGYYPDDAHKPNQDSYSVTHDFGGQEPDGFFAVYDGHGRDGDKCAHFARDSLPDLVAKHVARSKSREGKLRRVQVAEGSEGPLSLELTKEQVQAACLKAHVESNRSMHRSPKLDDSLSGTTAISLYVHGRRNRVTVCNVGDSRAILGQRTARSRVTNNGSSGGGMDNGSNAAGGALRALPLSRDQTPYRRDERIRVRATGARILSLDQIEGLEPIPPDDDDLEGDDGDLVLGEEIDEGGDPPRVWSPHGEYPGTAFTRSLGDAIAEELGVFAEPEMVTRELTPDDKIIVLASDGVFEFLTNQSVIDICAKFSDPLEACRAVVAESYELWLQYELRTDDITMICIFVDGVDSKIKDSYYALSQRMIMNGPGNEASPPAAAATGTEDDTVDAPIPLASSRPVRHHLSKEKSKQIEKMKIKMASTKGFDQVPEEDFDMSKLYTEKSDDEKARIAEAIRASVMFQNITDSQRELIFGVMEPISVKKGDWVIRQGTVGDRFYIVDSGKFEVRIVPEGETDDEGKGGNVVHVYEGSREKHAHPSFGELALMYSAPRAASIVAQTDGQLWGLHRFAFRKVLTEQTERKGLGRVLRKVDVFKTLDDDEIQNLASSMVESTFGAGETITRQGDVGDTLYVICQGGQCERHQEDEATTTLKADDCFGEEVIGSGERRYAATVVSTSTTTCWKLDKANLSRTLGSLRSSALTKARRRGSGGAGGGNVA